LKTVRLPRCPSSGRNEAGDERQDESFLNMPNPQKLTTRISSVMEDPSAQAVARVYAEAFLDAASAAGAGDALEEFTSFVDDVLAPNHELQAILLSAIVGRDQKIGLIERIVGKTGSQLFTNFLKVLASHERLDLLPLVLSESRTMHEKRTGRGRVQVTTAVELSQDRKDRVLKSLDESLPFEPILETYVKPSLLGGMVIQVGDTVYDSSLRSRLNQMRDRLRQRSLHEIQSGRDRFSHSERD
jgi:F-type H+-transporting ATPase subunit delta